MKEIKESFECGVDLNRMTGKVEQNDWRRNRLVCVSGKGIGRRRRENEFRVE